MLLFPSPPKPCRKNCQKQCANTGSGKSAYTLPFKADSAGEERQATYQERDRMEHLQFSIHFQIAFFILSFHRDFYTWYIRQNSCYDFIPTVLKTPSINQLVNEKSMRLEIDF